MPAPRMTTSGSSSSAAGTALAADSSAATTSISGCPESKATKPPLIRFKFSTMRTLITVRLMAFDINRTQIASADEYLQLTLRILMGPPAVNGRPRTSGLPRGLGPVHPTTVDDDRWPVNAPAWPRKAPISVQANYTFYKVPGEWRLGRSPELYGLTIAPYARHLWDSRPVCEVDVRRRVQHEHVRPCTGAQMPHVRTAQRLRFVFGRVVFCFFWCFFFFLF